MVLVSRLLSLMYTQLPEARPEHTTCAQGLDMSSRCVALHCSQVLPVQGLQDALSGRPVGCRSCGALHAWGAMPGCLPLRPAPCRMTDHMPFCDGVHHMAARTCARLQTIDSLCEDDQPFTSDLLQVEILAEGDHVNELMIVVGGLVEIARPSEHVMETGKDNDISTHGGSMGGQSMTLGTR
jgi:hypothetical protein